MYGGYFMNRIYAPHHPLAAVSPKALCISTMLLLMLFAIGISQLRAQNNIYKISDNLYELYMTAYNVRTEPRCLTLADSLYTLSGKQGDKKAQCIAATLPMDYYLHTNNTRKMEEVTKRCKEVARTNGYLQYYYHASNSLIVHYLNHNQSLRALQEASALKDQASKDDYPYGTYSSLRNLGNIYMYRANWRLAYQYYKEALDYMLANVKDQRPATIYQNVGEAYLKMNYSSKEACDTALHYYQKAIETSPSQKTIIQTKLRMLYVYFLQNDVESYNRVYDETNKLIKETGFPTNHNEVALSKVYHAMLNKSYSEARPLVLTTQGRALYQLLSILEERNGNYKEALQYYKEYTTNILEFRIQQQLQDIAELTAQTDNLILQERNAQLDLQNTNLTLEQTKQQVKMQQQQMALQQRETQYSQLLLYNRGLEIDRLKVDSALQRSVADRRHAQAMEKLHIQEAETKFRTVISVISVLALISFLIGVIMYRRRQHLNFKKLHEANTKLIKARDEAEAANRAKSAFIQNMSHEIRTPLNAIVGFSQVITTPDLGLDEESLQEYSKQISINSDMLTKLVYDVLSISELESGTYRVEHEPIHCNELCADLVSSFSDRTPPGVKLYWTSDVSDYFTIHSDSTLIRQVLVNFILNAQKFTEQGEIHLACSAHEHADCVTFSVADTGCGVPPEEYEHIFERFSKLNEFKQGLGLGLNICRLIANIIHATVDIDKTYTQGGARFVLILPKDAD